MTIKFEKTIGGVKQRKEVKPGWSWTVFFFGSLPLWMRQQYKEALIIFFLAGPVLGLFYIMKVNKLYTEKLLEEGWTPVTAADKKAATLYVSGAPVSQVKAELIK